MTDCFSLAKKFVGVPGFEPGKESELQRLPPYQLGYTPLISTQIHHNIQLLHKIE